MSLLDDNIRISRHIIESDDIYDRFDRIYPFPTENVYGCFKEENFKDKECLTVLGSSAQLFNMYLGGSKNVTCFDIQSRAKYYLDFLLGFISSNIKCEDYINMVYDYLNEFDCDLIFKSIIKNVTGDSKKYFETLYNNYGKKIFKRNRLFNYPECNMNKVSFYSGYFNDDLVKELYKIKDKINPTFYNCNITSLKDYLNTQFDIMYFSNIMQYANEIFKDKDKIDSLRKFKKLLLSFDSYLKEDGKMYCCYIYKVQITRNFNPIFNKENINMIFYEDNFDYNYFRKFNHVNDINPCLTRDACLIYKK